MRSRASRGVKREAEAVAKKMRSKRPRRRRTQISPVLRSSKDEGVSGISVFSSSGSLCDYDDNVSCGSVGVVQNSFVLNEKKDTAGDPTFRRITRSFYKKKQMDKERNDLVEVSESSCIESNFDFDLESSCLKVKNRVDDVNGHERIENDAVSVTRLDVISVEQEHVSDGRNLKLETSGSKVNNDVSVTCGQEFPSDSKFGSVNKGHANEALPESEFSEISKPNSVAESNFTLFNYKSVVEQQPEAKADGSDLDLTYVEQLQNDDVSDFSENATSDWLSDTFPENSDVVSLDYTPSIFFDSGSQFSEKSSDSSPGSETYSLFLEFKEHFSISTAENTVKSNNIEELYEIFPSLLKFEDEEEEETYQNFRERERRQVHLKDYADYYSSRTSYGDLVLRQRLQVVRWIIEECTLNELQQETMFLGVGLFDQLLRRGFFKRAKNLQIAGIACLALATRIEENQPYNCVRQRNFYVQTNKYSRYEVVAMEWLVQEVLNFQCFLPTIYNFLWFYLRAAKADTEVEKMANNLAILALSDHRQLRYCPSTVAAAVVILASIDSNELTAYRRVIQVHVRTIHDDLQECVKSLERFLRA